MTLVMQACNQFMDAISLRYIYIYLHTVHFSHKEVQRQGKLTAMALLLALQSPYTSVTLIDSQFFFPRWCKF